MRGFAVSGVNWRLCFLHFHISGEIPTSLFLISETVSGIETSFLFHFYSTARSAFLKKIQENISQKNSLCFEKVMV